MIMVVQLYRSRSFTLREALGAPIRESCSECNCLLKVVAVGTVNPKPGGSVDLFVHAPTSILLEAKPFAFTMNLPPLASLRLAAESVRFFIITRRLHVTRFKRRSGKLETTTRQKASPRRLTAETREIQLKFAGFDKC